MFKYISACVFLIVGFFSAPMQALDLELTQGVSSAIPIGIASFGDNQEAQGLRSVVLNDLKLSGQFKLMQASSADLSYWKRMAADSVLKARINALGNGRVQIIYQLIDVASQGRPLLDQQYTVQEHQLRGLAHHIADQVYEKLTGQRGVFSTKIAYIMVQREGGERARHSLEIADMDGYHPQSLLVSTEPIMSPSWSPDARSIAYVTFEKKRAQIYKVDVATGRRQLITSFPGINGAPAWSPNGRELIVVLSKTGTPKLYSVNLASGAMKQLTYGNAIDTEPRYSPDGHSIIFTSGRGGTPQIYRFNLASGQITRMTYSGTYNARPTFTPDQQSVVMIHREDRNFNIAVQSAHGGPVEVLTHSTMDESPTVSPNGRMILYATHEGSRGVLAMVSIDGRIRLKFPSRDGDIQEPAWSPFIG